MTNLGVKNLGQVFRPQTTVVQSVFFQIVQILKLSTEDITKYSVDGIVPAGTLVKTASKKPDATIIANPTEGVAIALAGEAQGVLINDVPLEDLTITDYSTNVIISGVVYNDAVELAIGTTIDPIDIENLAKQNILFYNVITLK